MTTALITSLCTLKRGARLWLYGTYPVIVTKDTAIPVEMTERDSMMIPVTNIIAFGDIHDESEYEDYVRFKELTTIWNGRNEERPQSQL